MIDEEETYAQFGHYSSDLAPQSRKQIVAVCDDCGKRRILRNRDYRPFCLSCSRKGKRNTRWNRVKRVCPICGKEFFVKLSWVKRGGGKYCSKSCAGKSLVGKKNPFWKGGKVKRVCKICGEVFYVKEDVIAKNYGFFCSGECAGKWRSIYYKGKLSPIYGHEVSLETREKLSRANKGKKISEECKRKISEALKGERAPNYGKHLSEETKQKLREARQKRRKVSLPTKPEVIFKEISLSNNISTNYTGDGSFWIGKKGRKQLNPDFIIRVNGKKICIEIMGDYWHSPLLNLNLREDALLAYRKKFFKKHGWHPIFIWESDLKREDAEAFVLNLLKKEGVIK